MVTPPNFLKIGTMEFVLPLTRLKLVHTMPEAAEIWFGPFPYMVGGKTTSGTEAFLLPWVSVAGVYLVPRGPM